MCHLAFSGTAAQETGSEAIRNLRQLNMKTTSAVLGAVVAMSLVANAAVLIAGGAKFNKYGRGMEIYTAIINK